MMPKNIAANNKYMNTNSFVIFSLLSNGSLIAIWSLIGWLRKTWVIIDETVKMEVTWFRI